MHVLSHSKITVEHWFLFFILFSPRSFFPLPVEIKLNRRFSLPETFVVKGNRKMIYIYTHKYISRKRVGRCKQQNVSVRITVASERDVRDMQAVEERKVVKDRDPSPSQAAVVIFGSARNHGQKRAFFERNNRDPFTNFYLYDERMEREIKEETRYTAKKESKRTYPRVDHSRRDDRYPAVWP